MRPITRRGLLWGSLYVLMALLPLGIALLSPPQETRGLLGATGVMFGLLALGVFGMQVVISGRHRWFAESVGFDNILQFHRQTGLLALWLVLLHPLLIFAADPSYLEFLDPRDDTLRAFALVGLLGASVVLIVSSLWRVQLGLSYEWWRLRRRPWQVVDNQPALGDATTLTHEAELPLKVIHVLSDPPAGWQGEEGYIDKALLERCLPQDDGQREYFICGPPPMMNASECALIELGVPATRLTSDRFAIV
ncbi:ferric reductase-like transmembrane domain-containing protein [Halomonas salipaludis]|uniref:Oxidoreductase n=1 Tax=Halomonas salipaludis TaxID=2032625 RepID=A0A2A2EVV7_9GAMM|nr:ferric reductase-like transmembrane domain-containing protein [Halomonas salipaludis]PAU76519.1 hypothetical protein CK498_10945 [Halomonas salipaludis]